MRRRIGVVSVARSDYGIYRPLLRRIIADSALELRLYVASSHLVAQFGHTVREIEADGVPIVARLETLAPGDTPEAIGLSMSKGVAAFAQLYAQDKPDILVVLGDRFDMYVAALAALPHKIPIAHIHGGEVTQGAIDDALRHSLTKLAHLHFTATEEYARRVRQLGEESWRVLVCGALSLDNIDDIQLLDAAGIEKRFGLRLAQDFLLVTFHPVTLEHERTEEYMRELLAALAACNLPVVFTLPNADTGSQTIIRLLKEYVAVNKAAQLVESLGTQGYFSLMKLAAAMVGNSSSGILEAPSFHLPVVNIGTRQEGRARGANVIDCGYARAEIAIALQRATSAEFKTKIQSAPSPYHVGVASKVIVDRLKSVKLDAALIMKKFADEEAVRA